MISIEIPGKGKLELEHLVLDYNGTIAVDGCIVDGAKARLEQLSKMLKIYVLTADTYGTVAEACKELPVEVRTFAVEGASAHKADFVVGLSGGIVCMGNGFNDFEMFKGADLSICVVLAEGMWPGLLAAADICTTSITDGLDLLLNTNRIRATLRT